MIYDTFLVLPLIMAAVALAMGVQVLLLGSETLESQGMNPALVQLVAVVTVVSFYSMFWRKRGQTLGMQAWRVKLQTLDGEPVALSRCLLRCAGATVSLLAAGAGYWWCLFDRNGRYWHDYWSNSELVLLPKQVTDAKDRAS